MYINVQNAIPSTSQITCRLRSDAQWLPLKPSSYLKPSFCMWFLAFNISALIYSIDTFNLTYQPGRLAGWTYGGIRCFHTEQLDKTRLLALSHAGKPLLLMLVRLESWKCYFLFCSVYLPTLFLNWKPVHSSLICRDKQATTGLLLSEKDKCIFHKFMYF